MKMRFTLLDSKQISIMISVNDPVFITKTDQVCNGFGQGFKNSDVLRKRGVDQFLSDVKWKDAKKY